MKATPSPLQLTDFELLNLQYRFVNPTDEVDVNELFGLYSIDVDFAIKQEDDRNFIIFTKAAVNHGADLPGYVLFAEGVSSFRIADPGTLPEGKRQNLLTFSGVGIALQQLRSRVADLTSFAPLGKYMLPTLDMDDLLKQKQERKEQAAKDSGNKTKRSVMVLNHELTISTFREIINEKLRQAQDKGQKFVDLKAGDLHREVGGYPGPKHQMPNCVNAMRQAMAPGDAVLHEPPKGAGPSVTIRYKLPR